MIKTESRRCHQPHVKTVACRFTPPLRSASLFHCSASFLSAKVVRSGSSVNYSTSQEGRGTWWWWGLGAGSQTIKPGSRPPALFTATIHCFLPVLCVSCSFRGCKCCWPTRILTGLLICVFVLTEKTLDFRKEAALKEHINNRIMKFQAGIMWVQLLTYCMKLESYCSSINIYTAFQLDVNTPKCPLRAPPCGPTQQSSFILPAAVSYIKQDTVI